nr:unnamed protein product [Callosobruchus chinensis]
MMKEKPDDDLVFCFDLQQLSTEKWCEDEELQWILPIFPEHLEALQVLNGQDTDEDNTQEECNKTVSKMMVEIRSHHQEGSPLLNIVAVANICFQDSKFLKSYKSHQHNFTGNPLASSGGRTLMKTFIYP